MHFGYNWLQLIHLSWVELELRFQLFRDFMIIIIANKRKMIDRAHRMSCSSSKVEGKERKKVKKERWACRTNGCPRLLPYPFFPFSLFAYYPIFNFYDQLILKINILIFEGFVLPENPDRAPILSRRLLSLEKFQPFSRWRYLYNPCPREGMILGDPYRIN